MGYRKIKVFLDTSVLIAGVVSSKGASAAILDLIEMSLLTFMLSRQVLIEADRNIEKKFPKLLPDYRMFIKNLSPLLITDPSPKDIKNASGIIHKKDAPILAAAINDPPDYLVTLDSKDFLKEKVKEAVRFSIVRPDEFLKIFKEILVKGPFPKA
ncbi:putative toxin-antitoxin system toxin component, PIN family [Elusimicrobiota bacterium]